MATTAPLCKLGSYANIQLWESGESNPFQSEDVPTLSLWLFIHAVNH